jgi:hypothetical protein
MILHLGGIAYETCLEYPQIGEISPLWDELTGEYDLVARLPGGRYGTEVLGQGSIWIEDGVLQMGGDVGPVFPASETEIIILSGPFAGETMEYDSETGNIYHQRIVFIRR